MLDICINETYADIFDRFRERPAPQPPPPHPHTPCNVIHTHTQGCMTLQGAIHTHTSLQSGPTLISSTALLTFTQQSRFFKRFLFAFVRCVPLCAELLPLSFALTYFAAGALSLSGSTSVSNVRSFNSKAVLSLQILGPADCDYSLSTEPCHEDCTLENIIGCGGPTGECLYPSGSNDTEWSDLQNPSHSSRPVCVRARLFAGCATTGGQELLRVDNLHTAALGRFSAVPWRSCPLHMTGPALNLLKTHVGVHIAGKSCGAALNTTAPTSPREGSSPTHGPR